MQALNRLSAKAVSSLSNSKLADGGGIWIVKRTDGGAQWVLRVTVRGWPRGNGSGAFHAISLAQARRNAEMARAQARGGLDPIKARQQERRDAVRRRYILDDIAADAFESRKAELKSGGKAGRSFSPLDLRVFPRLAMP